MDPWRVRVLDELTPHFETIVFNHRGLGGSDTLDDGYTVEQFAADAAGIVRALGYRRVAVLGFAIGSAESLVLARDFPDLVSTVAIAAPSWPSDPSKLDAMRSRIQREIASHGYEGYHRSHVDNDTTAFSPEFYRANREVASALGAALWQGHATEQVFMRHAAARASYDFGPWIERLSVPVLVTAGADDGVLRGSGTPVQNARLLAERLPNASLRLYPDARHMLPWQSTVDLVTDLRHFVSKGE